MSYISESFDRAHIQHVREFLLHGVECVEIKDNTLKQRIEEPQKAVTTMIQDKFPDMGENEKITDKMCDYVGAVQEVYMEIGLQCGAILAEQLLLNPQKE